MPIETTIAELTDAIKSLTKALLANKGTAAQHRVTDAELEADAKARRDATAAANAKKDQAAAEKKAVDTTATATAQGTAQTEKAATSGGEPASIDFATQIQAKIVHMAASGKRAEALAILGEFGAKRASDIKPEDYARAVELIGKVA